MNRHAYRGYRLKRIGTEWVLEPKGIIGKIGDDFRRFGEHFGPKLSKKMHAARRFFGSARSATSNNPYKPATARIKKFGGGGNIQYTKKNKKKHKTHKHLVRKY